MLASIANILWFWRQKFFSNSIKLLSHYISINFFYWTPLLSFSLKSLYLSTQFLCLLTCLNLTEPWFFLHSHNNIFPNKVFTLDTIYTLQVICCCYHQFKIYCYYVYYYVVHLYISIMLKSFCIYLIEHSSYWATISCSTSVILRFRKREPCKHNKQDFSNA